MVEFPTFLDQVGSVGDITPMTQDTMNPPVALQLSWDTLHLSVKYDTQ